MRQAPALLAAPLLLALLGCPYESALPLGSPEALDPRLLGAWRCAGDPADPSASVRFLRFDDKQYLVEADAPGEETVHFRTYPTRVAGVAILNVQEVKEGEEPQPYSFLRYKVEGPTLRFDVLRKEPLEGAATPAAVASILERRPADPALFESLFICTRPPGPASGRLLR